ncbi:hypothetical protein U9Z31_23340 [Escherichia coli]
MYFIKATVKHIKDGAVTSETFSELLNLATLELSAGVFARDVVEKFVKMPPSLLKTLSSCFDAKKKPGLAPGSNKRNCC